MTVTLWLCALIPVILSAGESLSLCFLTWQTCTHFKTQLKIHPNLQLWPNVQPTFSQEKKKSSFSQKKKISDIPLQIFTNSSITALGMLYSILVLCIDLTRIFTFNILMDICHLGAAWHPNTFPLWGRVVRIGKNKHRTHN